MRAFVITGPRESAVLEVPNPEPSAGQVIVDVERVNLAIDVRFTQPTRNQLRVLGAEIEDQDLRM